MLTDKKKPSPNTTYGCPTREDKLQIQIAEKLMRY